MSDDSDPSKNSDILLLGCFPAGIATACLLMSVLAFKGILLDVGDHDNAVFGRWMLGIGIALWAITIGVALLYRSPPRK